MGVRMRAPSFSAIQTVAVIRRANERQGIAGPLHERTLATGAGGPAEGRPMNFKVLSPRSVFFLHSGMLL